MKKKTHRTCKSEYFIIKVIFLVATASSRFDVDYNVTFFGKIRIFLVVTKEHAKRSSINKHA